MVVVVGQKISKWIFEDREQSIVLYIGKSRKENQDDTYFCQNDWGCDIPWYFSPIRDNW